MFADLPSSQLPQPLITTWQTGHLAVLWAATPFELVNERANRRLTANQWQETAPGLPAIEPELAALPPAPILSLDPTSRLQEHLRSAGLPVSVVQSRQDVPPQGIHVLYPLAGDLASRQGLVLTRQEIRNLEADKRQWLLDPWLEKAAQGAVLVLGARWSHTTLQAWWEDLLGPALRNHALFTLGEPQATSPPGIAPVAPSLTELIAALPSDTRTQEQVEARQTALALDRGKTPRAQETVPSPPTDHLSQMPSPASLHRPADVLTVEVSATTVNLTIQGTTYTGPNRVDPAALLEAAIDPIAYGEALFRGIIHTHRFPSSLPSQLTRDGFAVAQHLLRSGQLCLELRLDPGNLELHRYRWEYLKSPEQDTPLALQAGMPFYRYQPGRGDDLLVTAPRLKILAAICNPSTLEEAGNRYLENLVKLDVDQEMAVLAEGLQQLRQRGQVELRVLDRTRGTPVTLKRLYQALQDGYHVLHLVCHGLFVEAGQERGFYLVLEREDGRHRFVSAEDFQRLTAGNDLRLVVLVSCVSAISPQQDALMGLGPRLVRAGVPAVVAMQDTLSIAAARMFSEKFYDNLARSGRVDTALAATRTSMYWEEKERGESSGAWGIPALFLSTRDGRLFDLTPDAEEQSSPITHPPTSTGPITASEQAEAKLMPPSGPLSATQRLHLQTQLEELQVRHQRLSRRIQALNQDVDQALSQEQKDIFLERKAEREAERDEVARQMAEIERELQG